MEKGLLFPHHVSNLFHKEDLQRSKLGFYRHLNKFESRGKDYGLLNQWINRTLFAFLIR